MIRVLFVCTGNTCRSPMAEALLRGRLPESLRDRVDVSSAGIYASPPSPATEPAVSVIGERGLDLTGHRATLLTRELIMESDLVVAMTEAHAGHIINTAPEAHDKMIVLGALDDGRDDPDIRDPIGGGREVYESTCEDLEGLVTRLIAYIEERFPESV